MADFNIAPLVDYENIRSAMDQERSAFVKVNSFSEDKSFIRNIGDACEILSFLSSGIKFVFI